MLVFRDSTYLNGTSAYIFTDFDIALVIHSADKVTGGKEFLLFMFRF